MRILVLCLVLLATLAVAQSHDHQGAPAQKPAELMQGMGNLHHPIQTNNPECQKFFDQGMTILYGFNHAEAIRSFERAAELDPNAVMPLWGVAFALGPNYNMDVDPAAEKAAYDAAQKALAKAKDAPENERDYVNAIATRYSNDPNPDLKKLAVVYKNAMKALHEKYPDDLDAATLYADSIMLLNPWKLWTLDGQPAEGTMEVVSVLESVLKRDPNHVGANHYYIHAVEASPNPARALPSAKALETLVPAAGHLVHMPAHIYMRTGFYEEAAKANEIAAKTDEDYIKARGAQGLYPMMYYNHNLHFLAAANMMDGKYTEALAAAQKMVNFASPAIKEMPMIEPYTFMPSYVQIRFQKWDEILKEPQPVPSMIMSTANWHFGRGMAFAGTGKADEAQKESEAMTLTVAKIPADTLFALNPASNVFAVCQHTLDARIAEARGNLPQAIEHWKAAVAKYDQLSYDEPFDFYYPVRESLGAALYKSKQYADAEKVFREDLDHNPRSGRSLFGLMEALKAQDKGTDARMVEQQLAESWKDAEVKLSMDML